MRGVEHQVVGNGGELLVDAADDLADVAGIQVGDDEAHDLRPPAGQAPRLPVDDVAVRPDQRNITLLRVSSLT